MVWDYPRYYDTNFGISFGLVSFSLVFTAFIFGIRPQAIYALIKSMFGIEYIQLKDKEQPEALNLYEKYFELRKEKKWFSYVPRMCLWVTTGVVIGVTLIVFVDGIILNVIYLPLNQKCPDDGDMDCYSTSRNYTYFHCNSSDILIPKSLGSVTCYRWFKKGISTLEILEQIGLCAGLIQVFNWMVNLYLRLLLYVYAFPSQTALKGYAHPWLLTICTGVSLLSPIITLTVLRGRKVAVTGLTMAVVSCVLIIVFFMLILVWTWRRNTRLLRNEKAPLNNPMLHKSSETPVFEIETQLRYSGLIKRDEQDQF